MSASFLSNEELDRRIRETSSHIVSTSTKKQYLMGNTAYIFWLYQRNELIPETKQYIDTQIGHKRALGMSNPSIKTVVREYLIKVYEDTSKVPQAIRFDDEEHLVLLRFFEEKLEENKRLTTSFFNTQRAAFLHLLRLYGKPINNKRVLEKISTYLGNFITTTILILAMILINQL